MTRPGRGTVAALKFYMLSAPTKNEVLALAPLNEKGRPPKRLRVTLADLSEAARSEVLDMIADDAVLAALAGSKETTRRCQPVKE